MQVITPGYNLAGLLNGVHRQPYRSGRNYCLKLDLCGVGRMSASGPVWADRSETRKDYLAGFHQVVGHTPVPILQRFGANPGSITYTDVLQTKTAFYEVIIPD